MGITANLFDYPLYTGGSIAVAVPSFYEVALNGKSYEVDWKTDQILQYQYRYKHTTLDVVKQQADASTQPSEHSLSPDGLWRRSQEDWSHGAGQTYFDRPDSDSSRFRTSKGVDPWTRWEMTLLNDTLQGKSSAATNFDLETAGARLYLAYGQKMAYTTNLTAWTDVTGTNASTLASIASDGFHVYGAWTNGIGRTDTSTGAITDAWSSLVASRLAYVKNRLMAVGAGASAHILYEVTASGAAPAAYFTPNNSGTTWVGFAEGPNAIYAAAYSGDKSLIYRCGIKTDGTALDAPVVAGQLPDGEIVRAITSYLGFVLIGSDKGWRFAETDTNGNLTLGALVATASPVYCFEPQDRFVWYGLTNYDTVSSGLGRIDLSTLNVGNVPAYASDLMVTGQGTVQDVQTFLGVRVLAISGLGVYYEDTGNRVASGQLDSGYITYGLPDKKIAASLDVRHKNLATTAGSHSAWVAVDESAFVGIGTHVATNTVGEAFLAGQVSGERLEVRHTLTRGSVTTTAPVITRATLKAQPRINTILEIQVPLILATQLEVEDSVQLRDPLQDYADLMALRDTQQLVQYQEFTNTYQVVVSDVILFPGDRANYGQEMLGTVVLKLKTLDL